MAKTAAASKPEQTALAPANDQNSALAEALDFDFTATGLEGADATDIKIPALVFNIKGKDDNGRMRQLNEYLLTDTEEVSTEIRAVFVGFTKSHAFKVFNDAEKKNDTICSSHDRVHAILRRKHPQLPNLPERSERLCAGCPDKQWYKDEKGKNKMNCADVSNVFAMLVTGPADDDGKLPLSSIGREFMVRFAKTSLPALTAHLNKHHFKKHPTLRGKDVPLFAYEVVLKLDVDAGGNFATPVLTKGATLTREAMITMSENAKAFFEIREDYLRAQDNNEERHGDGDAIPTSGESTGGNLSNNDFV